MRLVTVMETLSIQLIENYIHQELPVFYQKRLDGLEKLSLSSILKKKNPYLFMVKNYENASDIVRSFLEAFISSSEEAMFGDWLEGLAIFINNMVYGGVKSATAGIDLEFLHEGTRYLVSIKSGPNWGNSDQVKKMIQNFVSAKKILQTSNAKVNVEFVNGCCYGTSSMAMKDGIYYKYCGQRFWEFISGDKNLYLDIIEPLGRKSKLRNEEFQGKYNNILNVFTRTFIYQYCDDSGKINWDAIVRFNSSYEK